MVVVIFRSRLRAPADPDYERWGERMVELAAAQPGFVSVKTFQAADGERITISEFESEPAARSWADHPAHREAQRLGRARFYSQYRIQVCSTAREYAWEHGSRRGRCE